MWQLATILDNIGLEHFHYCRKVYWTVPSPESAAKCKDPGWSPVEYQISI